MTSKLFDLEPPICDAVCASSILLDLLHDHFSKSHEEITGSPFKFYLAPHEVDNLLFIAGQAHSIAQRTKTTFYEAIEQNLEGGIK